ncbi:hypothetical protein CPB84DRAFT_1772661 [Gymnopilus junonius]|uniref:Uncharacterized protein n=1 Tax=Gymnopilus junonius TaxID=109634 RepID=A0A9P5TQF4_GYMJU|nr:hypothetical protein CPB84DRAFT_1772661 [Gymnopilus junonius]
MLTDIRSDRGWCLVISSMGLITLGTSSVLCRLYFKRQKIHFSEAIEAFGGSAAGLIAVPLGIVLFMEARRAILLTTIAQAISTGFFVLASCLAQMHLRAAIGVATLIGQILLAVARTRFYDNSTVRRRLEKSSSPFDLLSTFDFGLLFLYYTYRAAEPG